MNSKMTARKVIRFDAEGRHEIEDVVIREAPLTIYLNGEEFVTLLYTPEWAEMLAIGFLRSEGLIRNFAEIQSLRFDEEQGIVFVETADNFVAGKLYGKRTVTSGCGKGTVFYHVLDALKGNPVTAESKIGAEEIRQMMRQVQERAELFRQTGGIHSAALGDGKDLLYFCEDIGRHNAVDKLIGFCLRDGIDLRDKVLLTSGRVSSEILVKTAKAGIPFLVSRSAPTTLSIELAEVLGI
ncbi:MAG TPA: formate dehydrogenase accessory sulfurtransferase FdhD, partial [Firmicutes bacterium]|nr:formate dehydrogenase accessory sulfurtransferase FdhD [Bacillota bacterium]